MFPETKELFWAPSVLHKADHQNPTIYIKKKLTIFNYDDKGNINRKIVISSNVFHCITFFLPFKLIINMKYFDIKTLVGTIGALRSIPFQRKLLFYGNKFEQKIVLFCL